MNKSLKSDTHLVLDLCKAFDMRSGYEGEIPKWGQSYAIFDSSIDFWKMPPRIFRRDASTVAREKPAHLRQPPRSRVRLPAPPVSPAELEKQRLRRILKAERDERMDISMSLTPVKTYVRHR